MALRGVAHAALDISDGLAGDLMHILKRSGVRAVVDADAVPCSDAVRALPETARRQCTLAGGDDYELCFTVPASRAAEVQADLARLGCGATRIGRIVEGEGVRVRGEDGRWLEPMRQGWDHFAA